MSASNALLSVEDADAIKLDLLMFQINAYVAAGCMFFVVFNMVLLSTNKNFVKQYKILIALNIADIILITSIFLEGITRKGLYSNILATKTKRVVSSRDCIELWNVVQVYGDFSMPLIELTMGIERFAAVMFPSFYRNKWKRSSLYLIILSFVFAAMATGIPAVISFIWPKPNVAYLCGRKAALGRFIGIFDYAFNVIVISTALALNVATCLKAMKIRQSRINIYKIKCYTGVAFLSMILVSIPNLISIASTTMFNVPRILLTPSPILTCINGALQFFINFTLNLEFRRYCFDIITLDDNKNIVCILIVASTCLAYFTI
uniref:G_PROTEIN_RECEP_F1_2 domain-containing protein n=1 Tax=Panagrellus redivivus TaxID=6233 RepID=A0A7E4UXY0_PANRE